MRKTYHKDDDKQEVHEVQDALELYAREGARLMLSAALEEEVSAFLGRSRYQRTKTFKGYRNGYHGSRELTVGLSPVEVRVPGVSDVPPGVGGFESQIVRRNGRL